MNVSVLFFGATAAITGTRVVRMEIADGEAAGSVFQRVIDEHPKLSNQDLHFSINQEYASGNESLVDGDELAIFTAVSGG